MSDANTSFENSLNSLQPNYVEVKGPDGATSFLSKLRLVEGSGVTLTVNRTQQTVTISAGAGGSGGGGISSLLVGTGLTSTPISPLTTSGTVFLDLSYSPTWTGAHTFSYPIIFAAEQTFNAAGLRIASQAEGDLLYASGTTSWARVGVGTTDQVLTVSAGVPAWGAVPLHAHDSEDIDIFKYSEIRNITTAGWYRIAKNVQLNPAGDGRGSVLISVGPSGGDDSPLGTLFSLDKGYLTNLSDLSVAIINRNNTSAEGVDKLRVCYDDVSDDVYVEVYLSPATHSDYYVRLIHLTQDFIGGWNTVAFTEGSPESQTVTLDLDTDGASQAIYHAAAKTVVKPGHIGLNAAIDANYAINVGTADINVVSGGYRINGTAPAGHVLRGNGARFVSSQLAFSDLSGTAAVSQGGTGRSAFTSNGVVLGNNGSGLLATAAGSAYQVLRVPAGGGAPAFGAIDISQAAAATGVLPVARGGTGTSTGSIAGTEALTFSAGGANNSITLQPTGTGTVNVSSARITSLAEPAVSTDAATKQYVDSVAAGLHLKEAVAVTTTGPITLSGTQTIDSVALTAGQRVLVKNQSTASENGIYVVSAGAWSRATDADEDIEVTSGMFSFVELGSTYAATSWVLTTPDPITLGSTALTFAQFSGAGTYSVTAPLTQVGTVFGLSTPLAAQYGGTGISTYAAGDILYAASSSTFSRLPVGSSGQILTVASGVPSWESPNNTDPSANGSNSYLVSGGVVTWPSDYVFNITAAVYYIQGVRYESPEQTVTLLAADPTSPRIDAIVLTTSDTAVAVEGTPSANPASPAVDPFTQLEIGFVYVQQSSSQPTYIANTLIYAEDVEWTSSVSAGASASSTAAPYAGSKSVEYTSAQTGAYARFTNASTLSLDTYSHLVLRIRPKAGWTSASYLNITWRQTNTRRGRYVALTNGAYGLDTSALSYQLIAIPISAFGVKTTDLVNQLSIEVVASAPGIGLYIDDIFLQGGIETVPSNGITSIQAGAGITASPVSPIVSAGTLALDTAYSPTWTGTHTYSNPITFASSQTFDVTKLRVASQAAGDLLYASGTTSWARIGAGTTSQVLISGTTPSWGSVALGSMVSGTLPVTNGGTGATSYTTGQVLIGNNSGGLTKSTLTAGTGISIANGNGSITITSTVTDTGITSLNGQTGTSQTFTNDTNVAISSSANVHAIGWAGTLAVGRGGTGQSTLASNGVLLGNNGSAISATTAGSAYQVLRVGAGGGAPAFGAIDLSQSAAVTGALPASRGGTGLTSYNTGDLLYASGSTVVAGLSVGTNTQVLIGGDVPAWSAVNLSTMTSGTLPVAKGGTGATSYTAGQVLIGNNSGGLTQATLTAGTGISISNGDGSITIAATATGGGITSLNGQTGTSQTFTNDTNVTISTSANVHTIGWTGSLAAGRGGTGITAYASGDILYASGASTLAKLSKGDDGQVLTLASGVPSWATPSSGSEITRSDVSVTTSSLADDATDSSVRITAGKSGAIFLISTDVPARVRVYSTATARTSDLSRSIGTPVDSGSGLLAEVITGTSNLSVLMSPIPMFANMENPAVSTLPLSVTNLSGGTSTVEVTFRRIAFEA